MPLVFAAIAPHGFPLIPDLSDDAGGATVDWIPPAMNMLLGVG